MVTGSIKFVLIYSISCTAVVSSGQTNSPIFKHNSALCENEDALRKKTQDRWIESPRSSSMVIYSARVYGELIICLLLE